MASIAFPDPKSLMEDLQDFPEFLREPDPSIYHGNNYVVLDFETTTNEKGSPHVEFGNRMLIASWKCGPDHVRGGASFRVDAGEHHQAALLDDIANADFIVAHNTKFELGWLRRCGLDLGTVLPYCTMIGEKVLAGNRRWPLDLDSCLKKYGLQSKDDVGRLIRLGVDTESIPLSWLGTYCDSDVELTEQLFLTQRESIVEAGLMPVVFTRNILTPVLFDIETRGLHLDAERVNTVYQWHIERALVLQEEWNRLTGGVNINSPKQKRELFFDTLKIPPPRHETGKVMMTAGGKSGNKEIATDEPAIAAMKPRSKKAKATLECFKELQSTTQALSKVVGKMKNCVDEGSLLYATFNQASTGTHRLSSTGRPPYGVQLQNFTKTFRPCVMPRTPGWGIGDGDAAGIEFRTAVDLANDAQGTMDLADPDFDPHARTASIVYDDIWDTNIGPKEGANNGIRDNSKSRTFKPLYGGQSGTEKEQEYFKAFRERYPDIARMQEGWADEVLKTKKLRLACSGLVFYWPQCKMTDSGYILFTTNIYDYPIQSTATADMCPTATVYLWHLMRTAKMQSFLINLVHDSSVGEIHPDEREQWTAYAQWCYNELIVWYLEKVYGYKWMTPLDSEVKINPYWGSSDISWTQKWETQVREVK